MFPTRSLHPVSRAATAAVLLSLGILLPAPGSLGPAALSAQAGNATLEAGTRVRVASQTLGLVRTSGTVTSFEAGRLVLELDAGRTVSVDAAEIDELDLGTRTGHRGRAGMLIGAGVGALVGGVLGLSAGDDPACMRTTVSGGGSGFGALGTGLAAGLADLAYRACRSAWQSAGDKAATGVGAGGLLGGLVGWGIGRMIPVERWTRIDVRGTEVQILPTVGVDRTGVSITMPFGTR